MTVVSMSYFVKYSSGESLLFVLETFLTETRVGLAWISGATIIAYSFQTFSDNNLHLEIIKKLQKSKLNGKRLNPFLTTLFNINLNPYPKLNHVKGLDYGMMSPGMWKNYYRETETGAGMKEGREEERGV